jgi:hypothetical protein
MSATLINQPHSANVNIVVYQYAVPSLRELLTQGALAGAFAYFLILIGASFSIDNYYKLLLFSALPRYLGGGLLVGLFDGLAVYCCTRYLSVRVPWIARLAIAIVVFAASQFVLMTRWPATNLDQENWVRLLAFGSLPVLSFSFITGSHYRPWRALTYGITRIGNYQYLPATITGFLLRIVLLLGCFQFTLVLVCIIQMNEEFMDLLIVWLTVMHFLIGLAITLTNPKFWLATILAALINAPWIVILIIYFHEMGTLWFYMAGYLALWLGFLLSRCAALNPVFSFITEELRSYYLID